MICIFSPGIKKIPNLESFLGESCFFAGKRPFWSISGCSRVAGWGLKPTTARARKYASTRSLQFLTLEDGFLRSLGLGVTGSQPCSLIVDYSGIYYDSTRPSDLENMLNLNHFDHNTLQRAASCMDMIRELRLSKYNHAPDEPIFSDAERSRVLVVDQTFEDASVLYGGGDEQTFELMLDRAIADNPHSEILVKVHPDVIAGKKKGYLLEPARKRKCTLISRDSNPWALMDVVDRVYVLTSQLGFEALMAGKEVICFGLPFYAGWGLTRDMQDCPRRVKKRSLPEVFAAAYLKYCRYVNPCTGKPCRPEDIITLLGDQRRCMQSFQGKWLACGFSSWKKGFVADFLGPGAHVDFAPMSLSRVNRRLESGTKILAWSTSLTREFEDGCISAGAELWRMEDGFVRSAGLGVDLVRPMSLVLDSQGIYYDPAGPSDLEHILNTIRFSREILARAAAVRKALVELELSKYNVGQGSDIELPQNTRLILVPGQVETDASITKGSSMIKTNQALLQEVRRNYPHDFVIYKPHPDVLAAGRKGFFEDKEGLYDLLVTDVSITRLLPLVHEVHTMSSLAGFEALLRGIKVTAYGMPFYAGWGLTTDMQTCPRRTRRLSLDELVAGTLILYPVYVDPGSRQLCNIETVMDLIHKARSRPYQKLAWPWRLYRWFKFKSLTAIG